MDLFPLLDLKKMIIFAGAGGKTTAMVHLAGELEREGKRVVLTTTTKVMPPTGGGPPLILSEARVERARLVKKSLEKNHMVWVGATIKGGKLIGPPAAELPTLLEIGRPDYILVEADGSRGRPLKFPATYEPVLPPLEQGGAILVLVCGLLGLGKPLTERVFHRPHLAFRLLGITPGSIIEPHHLVAILSHPCGYGKCIGKLPVVILLNQADTPGLVVKAEEIASLVHRELNPAQVVMSTFTGTTPQFAEL